MAALIDVVLPVFLVVALGYFCAWRKLFSDDAIDAIVTFAQNVAIPCLLFSAIATLDLSASFDLALLGSFYIGAVAGFFAGLLGARYLFGRPWQDSVAIGFLTLFSNSVLTGLAVTERAFGVEALGPNYAIVAIHAPFCYTLGFIAMEIARADSRNFIGAIRAIARSMFRNPLMVGIGLGFAVNLLNIPLPEAGWDAVSWLAHAGLPVALFGLGGVLARYKPEGDLATIAYVCAVSLVLHPVIVWTLGGMAGLSTEQFRSAVITAAMAPGINGYIFANMYGVAKRVAASSVLAGTALSVVSAAVWLSILP